MRCGLEHTVHPIKGNAQQEKMCPAYKERERRINVAHPSKEKVQLNRNWWDKEREAKRRGWLRDRSERGWLTNRWVVTIVECVDYSAEGKKEELNKGQEHLPENSLRNSRCPGYQENWEVGQWEVSRRRATRVQCVEYGKVDAVPGRLGMEEIRSIKCPQCMKRKESREAAQPGKMTVQ